MAETKYSSIAIPADLRARLDAIREMVSKETGFKVSLAQTLAHIVNEYLKDSK